jgi:tryptophan-rich sensory protein
MGRLGLLLVFGFLNFGALGIGSLFMGGGPSSDWYQQLNKAPWTPPGWLFGVAWTTIMLCFTFFMADLVMKEKSLWVWILFGVQFVTNIFWNYFFFNRHMTFIALVDLVVLTAIVWFMFFRFKGIVGMQSFFVTPYMIWLMIAVSLNAYAWLKN